MFTILVVGMVSLIYICQNLLNYNFQYVQCIISNLPQKKKKLFKTRTTLPTPYFGLLTELYLLSPCTGQKMESLNFSRKNCKATFQRSQEIFPVQKSERCLLFLWATNVTLCAPDNVSIVLTKTLILPCSIVGGLS